MTGALSVQVHDLDEAKEMPDPEKNDDMEGMGGLGGNLEFMMLKLAQLETSDQSFLECLELKKKESSEYLKCPHLKSCLCVGDDRGASAAANQGNERVEARPHGRRAQCFQAPAVGPGGGRFCTQDLSA